MVLAPHICYQLLKTNVARKFPIYTLLSKLQQIIKQSFSASKANTLNTLRNKTMVFAEIFLSPFITVLFEKLASADLIKLAQSARIYSKLDKWKITLTLIQKVLADAGHQRITDSAVEEWLNTLHHLAYDIDDLLDDLATEAIRRHFNERSHATTNTNKVLKKLAPFTPRNFKYGRKMRSKLADITARLDQLVKQIAILRLVENVDRPIRTSRRLEETSLVDESKIMGREKDKEALLSKLLEEESSTQSFSVVSIVGLGGIEKTTLAQALYNQYIYIKEDIGQRIKESHS